jgi:hypothetical protein
MGRIALIAFVNTREKLPVPRIATDIGGLNDESRARGRSAYGGRSVRGAEHAADHGDQPERDPAEAEQR